LPASFFIAEDPPSGIVRLAARASKS